jgi:predicted dehydrogenase
MFKINLIGCGGMSNYGHGPACVKYAALHPDVELSACCDIDEEKAVQFSKDLGFKRPYTDIVTMLNAEKPDAVVLIVPPELTCELSIRVLDLGYPLITEKPPGMSVQEIDRMIAAADATGAATQVSFNRRYTPLIMKTKELVHSTLAPSQIQHIRYELSRNKRNDPDFTTTAIHAIDTAKFIMDSDYKWVKIHYQYFPELGPTTANMFLDCEFESGATGSIVLCPVTGLSCEVGTVYGENDWFQMSQPMRTDFEQDGYVRHFREHKIIYNATGPELNESNENWIVTGFYLENAVFFDDLRAGRKPVGDLRSGRQSVAIMQCLRERRAEYRAD